MTQYEVFEIAFVLQIMHFEGRDLQCKNCNKYIERLCEGGLNGSDDVKLCMINKASKGVI